MPLRCDQVLGFLPGCACLVGREAKRYHAGSKTAAPMCNPPIPLSTTADWRPITDVVYSIGHSEASAARYQDTRYQEI